MRKKEQGKARLLFEAKSDGPSSTRIPRYVYAVVERANRWFTFFSVRSEANHAIKEYRITSVSQYCTYTSCTRDGFAGSLVQYLYLGVGVPAYVCV
jgi:hypothetical protein